MGGLQREIHVKLDPNKIKASGTPLDLILSKIRSENVDVPAGTIERGNYEVLVRTPGIYTDLDEIRNTVIAIRDRAPIQLKEIATVEDTWQKVRRIVRINGKPGIRLSVSKQSGKNTVEVARAVLKEIEGDPPGFPSDHNDPHDRLFRIHPELHQQRQPFRPLWRAAGRFCPPLLPAQHPLHLRLSA